jgi:hypothetical protein
MVLVISSISAVHSFCASSRAKGQRFNGIENSLRQSGDAPEGDGLTKARLVGELAPAFRADAFRIALPAEFHRHGPGQFGIGLRANQVVERCEPDFPPVEEEREVFPMGIAVADQVVEDHRIE